MRRFSTSHDTSQLTCLIDIQVLDNPVWKDRGLCTLDTLKNVRDAWMKAVVVDRGSNPGFVKELKCFQSELIEIIDKPSGYFKTYGEQIRFWLAETQKKYDDDMLFWRLEPEKSRLISRETIWSILQFLKQHNNFEYISFMRKNALNMPSSQYETENDVAETVNKRLEKIGIPSFSQRETSNLEEWVGGLFWPFIATRAWIQRILDLWVQSNRDGNEVFFLARLQSYLEWFDAEEKNVLFHALDFHYDMECELVPELDEIAKIARLSRKSDFSLEAYGKENPTSLVYKRHTTRESLLKIMQDEITRYEQSKKAPKRRTWRQRKSA